MGEESRSAGNADVFDPDSIAEANIDAFGGAADEPTETIEAQPEDTAQSEETPREPEQQDFFHDPDDIAREQWMNGEQPSDDPANAEAAPAEPAEAEPTDPRDAQIAQLLADQERSRKLIDDLVAGVARGPSESASASETTQEPEPLGEPPDPVVDAKGFAEWVQESNKRAIDEAMQQVQNQRTLDQAQQTEDELWTEFTGLHPEWTEAGDVVKTVVPGVIAELGDSYTREELYEATHQAMVSKRAAMFGGKAPAQQPQRNKTAGMSVGTRRAAKPNTVPKEEPEPKGMVDQHLELQREMGLVPMFE